MITTNIPLKAKIEKLAIVRVTKIISLAMVPQAHI